LGPVPNESAPTATTPCLSMMCFLLPYIEQDNLYKQLDLARNANWWDTKAAGSAGVQPNANFVAAPNPIRTPICPSHNPYEAIQPKPAGVWVHAYSDTSALGLAAGTAALAAQNLAATTYAGCMGLAGKGTNTRASITGITSFPAYEGMFTNRSDNSIDRI